jgi:hypothetical protein
MALGNGTSSARLRWSIPCYRAGPRLLGMSSLPGLTRQAMLPKGTRMLRTGRFRHCIMDHRVKPGGDEVNTRPAT